jgi:hypothetical protein
MKAFVLLMLLGAFLALGAVSPSKDSAQVEAPKLPDPSPFPITVDFQCSRDFGFHIGDEIPLTIRLEAEKGVIVDLVNLPQKGEHHGPFEVRDIRVRQDQRNGRTCYEVSYQLQSFAPAIAVDRLTFPPLRISYATQEDWDAMESRYRYRDLLSQAFDVYASRTATYFGPMKDMKGPMADKKAALWSKVAVSGGGLMVVLGLITWPLEFIRRRHRARAPTLALTPADRALRALQEARGSCFNYDDHRKRLFFEINAILREFLKEVCGLESANRPSMEIMNQLRDRPFFEELRDLVTRINQVIYEGDAPVDVEPIVRQFSGLLQDVDRTALSGVKHDRAG